MENQQTREEIDRAYKDWSMGVITLGEAVEKELSYRTSALTKRIEEQQEANAKLVEENKALQTSIGAYKVLQSNHDIKISHYSKKAQDIDNAIQSLDSERKMNEILTNEKEDLEDRLKEAVRLLELTYPYYYDRSGCGIDNEVNSFINKEKTKQ